MIERIASTATTVAAVGCGLTAGVLLAFSIAIMPALTRRPPSDGVATMQQINVAIVSPVFLTVFLGGAAAAAIAASAAVVSGGGPRVMIVTAALLYLIGCIVVTMAINVPLNDALAAVDPSSAAGAELWSTYLTRWTRWNHARSAAAATAFVLLAVAAKR